MKISPPSKIHKHLIAKEYIGGLEITDTALHFYYLILIKIINCFKL